MPYQPSVFVIHVHHEKVQSFSNESVNQTQTRIVNENIRKGKSKAQKLRDMNRKETFLWNKYVCSSLPFYCLSDKQFRKIVSYGVTVAEETLSYSLQTAEKTIIADLQSANLRLESSNASLQIRLSEEVVKSQQAAEEAVKLQQAAEDTRNLKSKLAYEKMVVNALNAKNNELEEQIQALSKGFNGASILISDLEQLKDEKQCKELLQSQLSDLSAQVADLVSVQTKVHSVDLNSQMNCRKCGGADFHHPSACPANGAICENCGLSGHLTGLCCPQNKQTRRDRRKKRYN